MSRVFGLIQARMGSQRLPGKALVPLAGVPMIGHIVDRLTRVPELSGIVLATTRDARNDGLVSYAESLGVNIWREEVEDDIAARLLHAADAVAADAILKVNGDCPLIDPAVLRTLITAFDRDSGDYVSNKIVWSFPKGLSAEVIHMRALRWCHENLSLPRDREYVADWIKTRPNQFRVVSIESDRNLGGYEWMVDTPEDLATMASMFEALYRPGECFGLDDVLAYLESGVEREWL